MNSNWRSSAIETAFKVLEQHGPENVARYLQMHEQPAHAPAHAKFNPSSSYQWIPCSASANYKSDDTNEFAEFGTQVHDWLAKPGSPQPPHWTPDKIEAANWCEEMWTTHVPPNATREIKRFSTRWPALFFGTIDAELSEGTTLKLWDMKTGFLGVNADNNMQLLCYALLSSEAHPLAETFRLTIVQPRRRYVATSVYSRQQIQEFGEKVAQSIEAGAVFTAGDWCKYCPNRNGCVALGKALFKLLIEAKGNGLCNDQNNLLTMSNFCDSSPSLKS